MLPEFRNEPNIDFKQEANITAFRQALDNVRAQFGKTWYIDKIKLPPEQGA